MIKWSRFNSQFSETRQERDERLRTAWRKIRANREPTSKPETRNYVRYLVVTDRSELGPYLDKSDAEQIAKNHFGWIVELTGGGP